MRARCGELETRRPNFLLFCVSLLWGEGKAKGRSGGVSLGRYTHSPRYQWFVLVIFSFICGLWKGHSTHKQAIGAVVWEGVKGMSLDVFSWALDFQLMEGHFLRFK